MSCVRARRLKSNRRNDTSGRARVVIDHRVSFDLEQPIGVDEARHLHDRVDGTDVPEELAVHRCHRLPIVDARKQNSGSHDVVKRGTSALEGGGDDLEASPGLRGRISQPHRTTVGGAVPATLTIDPARTAREMPTFGS